MKAGYGARKLAPSLNPLRVFIPQISVGAKTIMSAPNLNYYEAVLADLLDERQKIDLSRQRLDLLIEGLQERIHNINGFIPAATILVTSPQNLSSSAYVGMAIHEAVEKYLASAEAPQTVRQILDALVEGGQSDINYNAVYTAMWRRVSPKGRFIKVDDSLWGLTDEQPVRETDFSQEAFASKTNHLKRGRPSQLDLSENALRQAGQPKHINWIISKLAEQDRPTTVHSLSSTLRQDGKKRFENLGQNVWALTEWPDSIKHQDRKETPLLNEV